MAKSPTKPRIVSKRPPKAATTPAIAAPSKQDQVLALLRRQNGASIEEIVETTDWQPHSARAFLSGAVKKRLGIDVISEKGSDGVRRYHVAALRS